MIDATQSNLSSPKLGGRNDEQLRKAAAELEASFLSEMLKAAKFGESRDTFGGGIGEEQFSSFLRQAHAQEMVKQGGIGLAESLFEALKGRLE
jgi:Rod binding domain-containing protein